MKNHKLKYNILLLFLSFFFLLSSCSSKDSEDYKSEEKGLLSIKKPEVENEIIGKWKLKTSYKFNNLINNSDVDKKDDKQTEYKDEIFITDSIFEYKNIKILDPSITARYVNIQDYMNSKSLEKPSDLDLKNENVIVYKFQDDKIVSQDIIQLSDGNLLSFQKDELEVFERYTSIGKEEEKKHYVELKDAVEGKDDTPGNSEYAITLGVRKNNYSKTGESLDYEYSTYFLVKGKDTKTPRVLSVKDIVFSKDSVLWTVSHERSYTQDASPLIVDKVSVNPTFRDDSSKVNYIEETIARRIDYINDNYIAFTNKNQMDEDKYEYYEIHNINQLAKNKPLSVNNIGGPKALESLNTAFSDTLYSIATQSDNILDYKVDDTNIGMVRNRMAWNFVSNFQTTMKDTGKTLYKSIPLKIIPILDLGSYDNKNISWRDVLNRVPFATNAIVSPDGKTIIIQSKNQISLYSIYNNFISLNPQLTITNVYGTEIIMSKWYPKDMISTIYKDYQKLPRMSTQLNY